MIQQHCLLPASQEVNLHQSIKETNGVIIRFTRTALSQAPSP